MKAKVLFIIVCLCISWMNSIYAGNNTAALVTYPEENLRVQQSELYRVYLNDDMDNGVTIFKNVCNTYFKGMPGERKNDDKPLTKFKGRSIHWGHFSFQGQVKVTVQVNKNIAGKEIKVYPSRHDIKVNKLDANRFSFVLDRPGQFSVEIGEDGYKEGLLIFADPMETDVPADLPKWKVIEKGDKTLLSTVSVKDSALYFKKGVHDIGVCRIPSNIKRIYLEGGAWVFGSFIMDGKACSNVKIYGRGVLSGARLHLRESHMVEAKSGADGIVVDGIVIADYSFFAVRLLGMDNEVSWTKIVGGWIYNCDGIAAYANSTIRNCFIWANDDNIKIYRDNIVVEDVVCWQLDNGAIFQLNWSNSVARNCRVSRVDIIRAEWDSDRPNNGILSCRNGGGADEGFVFEDVRTDTPVTHIFRLSPLGDKDQLIKNFLFKDWDVWVDVSRGKKNYMEGVKGKTPLSGLVFENFRVNGKVLTEKNMHEVLRWSILNCEKIGFR